MHWDVAEAHAVLHLGHDVHVQRFHEIPGRACVVVGTPHKRVSDAASTTRCAARNARLKVGARVEVEPCSEVLCWLHADLKHRLDGRVRRVHMLAIHVHATTRQAHRLHPHAVGTRYVQHALPHHAEHALHHRRRCAHDHRLELLGQGHSQHQRVGHGVWLEAKLAGVSSCLLRRLLRPELVGVPTGFVRVESEKQQAVAEVMVVHDVVDVPGAYQAPPLADGISTARCPS